MPTISRTTMTKDPKSFVAIFMFVNMDSSFSLLDSMQTVRAAVRSGRQGLGGGALCSVRCAVGFRRSCLLHQHGHVEDQCNVAAAQNAGAADALHLREHFRERLDD